MPTRALRKNGLEKLATIPDTFNECPRKLKRGVGGSEGRKEERCNERSECEGGGSAGLCLWRGR